jgi:histidinol-phosphate aminotransferase
MLKLVVGDIGARMTVVRLADGGLFLHSPVRLDDETKRALDDLGPVRAIVAPSKVHHLFAGEYARAYPAARLYGAPGLAEKRRELRVDAVLGDEAAPEWRDRIDQHLFRGAPVLNEVIFLHAPSRTLVLTDLAFNVPAERTAGARLFYWLTGAAGRFGPHRPRHRVARRRPRERRPRSVRGCIRVPLVSPGVSEPTSPRSLLRASVRAVVPYVPGEQPAPGRRVIKLNTNENPYPPSPLVLEALRDAIDGTIRLYPDPEAQALRRRASDVYRVPVDHIMAGNGSDELLALLLRATVDPGERVAFPVPTYSLYETLVAVQGGEVVQIEFPDDWSLPRSLASAGARVTFLCNPNSPSGTVVPLDAVDALAREVRGVVVVDEAYVDFADGDAMSLVGRLHNVVVLRTFSKSFSLAGLRAGLAFAHPDLLSGLRTVKDSYNLNRLTQLAAEAALSDLPHMQANVSRIRATRARLSASLVELGYRVPASHANFVLARWPGRDQAPVAAALADRGVLVRHFPTPRLLDALRITVGTDEETDVLVDHLRTLVAS